MFKLSPTALSALATGAILSGSAGYLWVASREKSAQEISPIPSVSVPKTSASIPRPSPISVSPPRTPPDQSAVFRDYSKVVIGMNKKEVRWWAGTPDRIVPGGIDPDLEHWLYGFKESSATQSFGVRVVSGSPSLAVTFLGSKVIEIKGGESFSYTEFAGDK